MIACRAMAVGNLRATASSMVPSCLPCSPMATPIIGAPSLHTHLILKDVPAREGDLASGACLEVSATVRIVSRGAY